MESLKDKVNTLQIKDNEKSREIANLNDRLEMLYATVEQIVAEGEDIIEENPESTPVVKTKKRRKAKQHPTPSPTHHHQPVKRTRQLGDGLVSQLTALMMMLINLLQLKKLPNSMKRMKKTLMKDKHPLLPTPPLHTVNTVWAFACIGMQNLFVVTQ